MNYQKTNAIFLDTRQRLKKRIAQNEVDKTGPLKDPHKEASRLERLKDFRNDYA